ncbi:sugar kinase, partial [Candidatus Woesearchaeota archaeon]|nr:sugar kinase [Candidatus Woesearchaeota archaeon]
MDLNKIILIKKRTPLEDLLRRHTTKSQVKFYLESRGESFEYYQKIHNNYVVGFENIKLQLPKEIRKQEVLRDYLDTFQFGENDLIVVVGGDGLLVNAAKYVGEQPAILVNPDPENHGGVLATCDHVGFSKVIKSVLSKNYEVEELTMAQAKLDDGQILFALNDLFIGRQTHISARYRINYLGREERQSSSGLIVTTGTGSTGWFTSIELGARKISEQLSSIGGSYARGRDVAGDNLTEFFKLTTSTAFNR